VGGVLAGGFPLCCFPPLVWCFPLWLCGGGPPLRFFCQRLQLAFMTSYTAPSGGSASDDWTKPGRTHSKARSITRADDPADSALRQDPSLLAEYRSLVGALLYCSTVTRPDIACPVAMLCRCMSRPTPGPTRRSPLRSRISPSHARPRTSLQVRSPRASRLHRLGLDHETLHIGQHYPVAGLHHRVGLHAADLGGSLLLRGGDHGRLRGRQVNVLLPAAL